MSEQDFVRSLESTVEFMVRLQVPEPGSPDLAMLRFLSEADASFRPVQGGVLLVYGDGELHVRVRYRSGFFEFAAGVARGLPDSAKFLKHVASGSYRYGHIQLTPDRRQPGSWRAIYRYQAPTSALTVEEVFLAGANNVAGTARDLRKELTAFGGRIFDLGA